MANRTPRISPEQQARMVEMYAQGISRRDIAREMGTAIETVTKYLTANGVSLRPWYFHKITPEAERDIVARYEGGALIATLATDHGCDQNTIRKVLRRHKVAHRDDRGRARIYTAEERETVRRMAAEGKSQNQIALALGSAQMTISKLMREEGIAPAQTGHATGARHYNWSGGRTKHPSGYWQVRLSPDDPLFSMANRAGTVMEHRLVMARSLGRPLERRESVHHINGDRMDNRIENLQLRKGQHGHGHAYRCLDCGSHNVVAVHLEEEV